MIAREEREEARKKEPCKESKRTKENRKVLTTLLHNFLPFVDNIEIFLNERNNKVKNRTIIELLEGLINYKLVKIIF